jgi:hypothetical protein
MAYSSARVRAKEIIRNIAKDNGWMDEDDKAYISARPSTLQMVNGLRRLAAKSAKA